PPHALVPVIAEIIPRYVANIELAFDGTRARPQLSAIEIPPVGDVVLSRQTMVRLVGALPPGTKTLVFGYAERLGSAVLRIREGERIDAVWLKNGERSPVYVVGRGFDQRTMLDVIREYVVLGFTHILPLGLDHILFVLGLFLLSPKAKPLLVQVTAFTIAHSVTLALSVYGVVSLPSS